jgi:hypothetical protein
MNKDDNKDDGSIFGGNKDILKGTGGSREGYPTYFAGLHSLPLST